MKIVALAGSPRRRGNTELLLDAFLEGAKSKGAKATKVVLNRLKIKPCQACYACKKTGKCKQKDDMKKLLRKLLKAEVWVFATPVYWWGPSAQLKLALDRMFPFCHPDNGLPEKIKGKKFFLITASEDDPTKATPHVVGMLKESMNYLEIAWAGELLVQAGKKGEVKKNDQALKEAREMGERAAG